MLTDFQKLLFVYYVREVEDGLELVGADLVPDRCPARSHLAVVWDDALVGEFRTVEPTGRITIHSGEIEPVHVRRRGWCYQVTGCNDLPNPPYFLTDRHDVSTIYEGRVVLESVTPDWGETSDDELESDGAVEDFVVCDSHFGVLTETDSATQIHLLRLFGCRPLSPLVDGRMTLTVISDTETHYGIAFLDPPTSER